MIKYITAVTVAAAIAVPAMTVGVPATAATTLSLQTKSAPSTTRMARVKRNANRIAARGGQTQGGYPNDRIASAWTAACYAEFGPNAKYPDAGMLQWCLEFGS